MKMTRRTLATVLASATVAAAQQPPPAPASTPAPTPPTTQDPGKEDLGKAARDRMQANARALTTPAIPMATEPAFQFKA